MSVMTIPEEKYSSLKKEFPDLFPFFFAGGALNEWGKMAEENLQLREKVSDLYMQ